MTFIFCEKNRGYKWSYCDDIYFKGYIKLDDENNIILREQAAIDFFKKSNNFQEFLKSLRSIDGVFSVICKRNETTWCAVDMARSLPIYFSEDGQFVSDSSELLRKKMKIKKEDIEEIRAYELINSAFIAHNNTIYTKIKQLDIGQAAEIRDNHVKVVTYFKHIEENTLNIDRDEAKELLKNVSNLVADNIIKVSNGRPIVMSLSGGYDSRYLACILKARNVRNVSCYTYGGQNSFEVEQSKKVADALGYRWAYVEHTDKKIKNILTEGNTPFFDYCNEHDYSIYLQNYVAVKELHEKKWFPTDAIFITGLCHDMPTGSYVKPEEDLKKYPKTIEGVAHYIYDKRFVRYRVPENLKSKLIDEIILQIELKDIGVNDYKSFVKVLDSITTGYDHSRRFLPMNKVHDYFGYEWLLPCWDKKLLTFWYSLPPYYRIKQNLYEEWLLNYLFDQYDVGNKKTILRHSRFLLLANLKRSLAGFLVQIFYQLGMPIRRKTDQNNFSPLEALLYKGIRQKRHINYKRASIILLLTLYVMEKKYGENCLDFLDKS